MKATRQFGASGSGGRSAAFPAREVGLASLIVLAAVGVGLVDSGFLAAGNLRDMLVRCAPTAIVSCGVMLVVVIGEIDISVGSLMALLAAAMGLLTSTDHLALPVWVGLPLILLMGVVVGSLTGLLVSVGKVPSIIVTLGLLTSLRGVTTLMMRGSTIDNLPASLSQASKYGLWGLPLGIWLAVLVIAATGILIRWTNLGRQLFALGSSGYAAEMIGLPRRRLTMFVFAYTGLLTAVATIAEVPRLPKIESGIGSGFELLVVTCVAVGGVSITGGRGRLGGVVLAVVLMTMIRPVLTFLDIGEAAEKWTRAIQGALILVAVIGDTVLHHRARRGGL